MEGKGRIRQEEKVDTRRWKEKAGAKGMAEEARRRKGMA